MFLPSLWEGGDPSSPGQQIHITILSWEAVAGFSVSNRPLISAHSGGVEGSGSSWALKVMAVKKAPAFGPAIPEWEPRAEVQSGMVTLG